MATSVRIRTETGEQGLDLEEFEARVIRGEIAPHCLVYFPTAVGPRWVRAGDLELYRLRFDPNRHTFARRFHLSRIPLLTVGFLLLNLAVFLAMSAEGPIDTDSMVRWGAKVAPLIGDVGQFWRLLTANVIHRDWVHIGFNAFVLFNLGGALENVFRRVDYLLLLFASGLGCTLTSLALAPQAISVGMSGIAYGCMGGAVVFGLKYREILPGRYRRLLGEAAIPTVLVFLYIGWTSAGVDNWGHLGGLFFGAATAALLPARLLLTQPTSAASTVVRLLPIVGVTLFLLVGGRALAPALPPLAPIRDDEFGLQIHVPTTWGRGADRFGQLAFTNGLPGLGRAAIAANAHLVGPERTLRQEADEFVHSQLETAQSAGRISALEVSPPQPAQLAGRDALSVEARYQDEGGTTHVRALFVPRGSIIYQVVLGLPAVYPDYERVGEDLLEAIHFTEPRELRQARARALLAPGGVASLTGLGATLAQLGDTGEAAELLLRAEALKPIDGDLRALRAEALLQSTQLEAGCQEARLAEEQAPRSVEAALAAADCRSARGDAEGAKQELARARTLAPDDRRIGKRLEALP